MQNRFFLLFLVAALHAAAQSSAPLPLSLKRAVEIALAPEGNARIEIAAELIRQSEARATQARAALLPDVSASLSQSSQTRNLAAFGIRFNTPIPGFQFPELVGPFNVFDARATVTQNIFDWSAIRRFQAAKAAIRQSKSENESTRHQVTEQVARAYLAALREQAVVETAKANVELAEALLKLARSQREAGTGTGIEITRAQVQLSNDRQRLLVAENDLDRARQTLLRVLGIRLDTPVDLIDKLALRPVDSQVTAKALELARSSRADLEAQRRREETARLSYNATKMERLPSLAAQVDYGSIGSSLQHALPTRLYGVVLRVPVFDGGRMDARRAESASLLRQERIRTRDLAAQVELDVRLALDSLRSAESQVLAAEEGLQLAQNELAQARRRYEAGVSPSLELTDAQTRLARARDNRVAALFNHNLARIDLGAAAGTIPQMIE